VPRTERHNRLSDFDLNTPSPIAGKMPQFPNLVRAMRFVDDNNRHQTNNSAHAPGFPTRSEFVMDPELDDPRLVAVDEAGNAAESGVAALEVGEVEVWAVDEVEHLGSEL